MNQNIQQIVSDRIALEIGRLTVSKILLETELDVLQSEQKQKITELETEISVGDVCKPTK